LTTLTHRLLRHEPDATCSAANTDSPIDFKRNFPSFFATPSSHRAHFQLPSSPLRIAKSFNHLGSLMTFKFPGVLLALFTTAALIQVVNADDATPQNTNWLSYNHNVNGQRYVPLAQINTANAAELGEVCRVQVEDIGAFHTAILHVDGVLFFTTASDTLAVDSTNCKVLWRNHYVEEELESTAIRVNRGVAYANGRVFRGTVDSRFMAIDAKTGTTLWVHQVGDPQSGEFYSAAPQVYQGLVIMGAAGGDWGIRGRIAAFDQVTGREVWRFHTIPRGDEVGADSWKHKDSARMGGGGTWTTFTLDVSAGEVFVPVGNPAPDLLPDKRPGENLFTNSLVVLDANTGALKWYHQLLSNDGQDLDLGAAPVLYYNKVGERMVAFGGKDGYAYGVNRETKKRIFKTPVAHIKNSDLVPTPEGVEVCPGLLGGVEWNGPAYDKPRHALVVGSVDWCALLKSDPDYKYVPGGFNMGGTFELVGEGRGWIYSIDADTGAERWKIELAGPHVSGITPTSGGVIFSGDLAGNFFTLDSETGKRIYQTQVGGGLAGGVITYMRGGKQYVAFTSGNVSRLTFGDAGHPTLHIFALGAKQPTLDKVVAAQASLREPDAAAGQKTYANVCAACHGGTGEGGMGPTLAGISARLDPATIVEWIKNPSSKMPRLFPSMLSEQAVHDVAAYLKGL
jgi:alcohol dehydrogenase (cytochrome c)